MGPEGSVLMLVAYRNAVEFSELTLKSVSHVVFQALIEFASQRGF